MAADPRPDRDDTEVTPRTSVSPARESVDEAAAPGATSGPGTGAAGDTVQDAETEVLPAPAGPDSAPPPPPAPTSWAPTAAGVKARPEKKRSGKKKPSAPGEKGARKGLLRRRPRTLDEPLTIAVEASALQLTGRRGRVYGPLDLSIDPGRLTVLHGPQGAGRTSLLLTLAGRMVPDRATKALTVLGGSLVGRRSRRARRRVQRAAAIAGFRGVDDLDESVTVGNVLRERLGWLTPWYRPVRRISPERYRELAAPVFGDRALPALTTVVWDLEEIDEMLLRLVLATAQKPRLLVVDDVDRIHDQERRDVVWERLAALAASGLTVVASAAEAPSGTGASVVVLAAHEAEPKAPGAKPGKTDRKVRRAEKSAARKTRKAARKAAKSSPPKPADGTKPADRPKPADDTEVSA